MFMRGAGMKKSSSGYTLLEIMIVLVMIGVLAGVALPKLFGRVEFARAAEAMASLGEIKGAIEACAMSANNDFSGCVDYAAIDMTDPSYNTTTNATAYFSYTFTIAPSSFQIVATRNTMDNGTPGDTITLARNSNGAFMRSGTTAFIGIQ
jgi:prepilin-type N-terminal cleavage/methylation domain-containing protein